MLSVVVPVFNRLENMKLCLAAIQAQKKAPEDLEIIIADDGSTDGLKEWLDQTYGKKLSIGKLLVQLRYISGGPNKGFRGGRIRNIAAFNAVGDRFIFIDSDVVLNQWALHHYADAVEENESAIIVGAYHWLPPLDWYKSNKKQQSLLWISESFDDLMEKSQDIKVLAVVNDSPFGYDVRWSDFTDDLYALRSGSGLGALSGNISYPKALFWELGGFDERIVGHGGEDADLGLTADEHQTKWLFYRPVFGFHLWHPRNQEKNSREVQANIAFIDAKHGVGQYANAKKWTDSQDWKDPIHYHKHLGSSMLKIGFDPQVYVYREGHYIKLSSPEWLIKLGFTWDDIELVEQSFFDDKKYEGDTSPDEELQQKLLEQEEEHQRKIDEQREVVVAALGLPPELIVSNMPVATTPQPVLPIPQKSIFFFRKTDGGRLIRAENEQTVFVVRENFRMGISHPDWIIWMGFGPEEVDVVPMDVVNMYIDAGPTPDIVLMRTGDINRVDR